MGVLAKLLLRQQEQSVPAPDVKKRCLKVRDVLRLEFLEEWEKGKPIAQKNLGFMFYNGLGVQKDYKVAAKWFRKSAEQGNAKAQHNLGVSYENGHGVPKDFKSAVEWYRKSAENGHSGAQYNLGIMHVEGRGVPRDYIRALMWWNISSGDGNENAIKSKGLLEKIMTGPEIQNVQRLSREWMEKHKKKK